jgi:nucleoside-diphosphate-sugar epimerase
MKIFVTGASGFVGGSLVERLCNEHTFYAMARSEKAAEKVKQLGAIPVLCELGKVKEENLSGCEMVIHSAAFIKEWGTRKEFWETTVEGTRQLLDVSRKAGVKKFIQISTEALLFTGQDLNNVDETYPYPTQSKFLYSESKLEAEKLALASNAPGFEVSVIRPRLVWGPGDQTVLPVLINMIKQNKFFWINGGKNITSHTHIYNTVEGIRCLINNWKGNEVYFITDEEVHSYKEFLTKYINTQGITIKDKSLPKGVARFMADIMESIWKLFNLKSTPPITKFPAYMMSSNFIINIAKAKKDLHYKPVIDFESAMQELSVTRNR